MRRIIFSVAFLLVAAGALFTVTPVQAQIPGVPFTVHKATCPVDFEGSIYDACHDNVQAGVGFEISGLEMGPDHFVTDANGVGSTLILEGMTTTSDIGLVEDEEFMTEFGAYVYCSDQNTDDVLFDGPADEGLVFFESLSNDQDVVCDWYNLVAPKNGDDDGPVVDRLPNTGAGMDSGSSFWMLGALLFGGAAAAGGFAAVASPRRMRIGR